MVHRQGAGWRAAQVCWQRTMAGMESQFLAAEALLEMKNKESQGIQKIGEAEAEALRLKELASISAQIELARAIGENGGYQGYLIAIRQLEACEVIGVEQAKAMSQADLKVIANGGSIGEGMNDIKDIISARGACSSEPCWKGWPSSLADFKNIAAHLYKILRGFDAKGVDYIFSESFFGGKVGEAIMNRPH